jgi:hypothetical protein
MVFSQELVVVASVVTANRMLQSMEFNVELTPSLHIFTGFTEHLFEHAHIKNRHKEKATLGI